MLQYLKAKIKNIFTIKNNIADNKTVKLEEQIPDREVLTVNINEWIEINIKEECTLNEYSKNLDKHEEIKNIFMPIKTLFTNSTSGISFDTKLVKQKIYIIEKDNLKFFITLNNDQLQISQYKTIDSNIYETVLEINNKNNEYKITKLTHDLGYSTGEVKWYPSKKGTLKFFILEEQDAIILLSELLNNLQNLKNINNIIDFDDLCIFLNTKISLNYYSIISDDVISLSTYVKDINGVKRQFFRIILKDTDEYIGFIKFDYNLDVNSEDSYGNIFYKIWTQYQNKGYATRALKLLKKVVENNQIECNKDMYFWVDYYNKYSKKVILNNGGEVLREGTPISDTDKGNAYILKIKI